MHNKVWTDPCGLLKNPIKRYVLKKKGLNNTNEIEKFQLLMYQGQGLELKNELKVTENNCSFWLGNLC